MEETHAIATAQGSRGNLTFQNIQKRKMHWTLTILIFQDKPNADDGVSNRRPSVMDKFKFSFGSKKDKKRKTNDSVTLTEELPPPPEEVLEDKSH